MVGSVYVFQQQELSWYLLSYLTLWPVLQASPCGLPHWPGFVAAVVAPNATKSGRRHI